MALYQHDSDFFIQVDGQVLMSSRQHESELELARLGCAQLGERRDPKVLIGGLGLGYTLRQSLDMLGPGAAITVCELLPSVVDWNREYLGGLNGNAVADPRVTVELRDVGDVMREASGTYDAILLDVDNGPSAISDAGNERLYGSNGIRACRRALTRKGCLAVWSVEPDKAYERALMRAGLTVRRYRAQAHQNAKSHARFVWVAAATAALLPPGGGEPRKGAVAAAPRKSSRRPRRR